MPRSLAIAALAAATTAFAAGQTADPHELWEQIVQAKGGRDRLHRVQSLAVYMKAAQENLRGPGTNRNWLFVLPDRYFEFEGGGGASQRAVVVDRTADRVAMDATGIPRKSWHLTAAEQDQLALNQIVFLQETAWLVPQPLAVRRNLLTVQASGRTYKLFLNKKNLPERIVSPPIPGQKPKIQYEYRLDRYRNFEGVMLPTRVTSIADVRQWVWDTDYEIDAKYNPKLFARMPDLGNGPEPWRQR